MLYLLLCSLLCMAMCRLIQGQSAHLSFILELRSPLVCGADLSANADEHVAAAKIKTFAPFGTNKRGFSTHSCFSRILWMKICLYIFCLSSVFYQHFVSRWMVSAVQKLHWPWQKELPSITLLHTNVPAVALRYEYIWELFWILLPFIESVK